MKKMFKKILAFLFVVTMLFGSAPLIGLVGAELPSISSILSIHAKASTYSGTFEDRITWSLDTDTGVLTVSGTGKMSSGTMSAPWRSLGEYVKTVEIGNGITDIDYYDFNECPNIVSVTIPQSVTLIDDYAFSDHKYLKTMNVDEGNQYYSSDKYGALFNKDKTVFIRFPSGSADASYVMPESVTSINECAFSNCNNLTGLTISENITEIGWRTFYKCENLASITIPDSITEIDDEAFYGCTALETITLGNGIQNIGVSAFEETAYYNNEENWSNEVLYIGNYLIKAADDVPNKYNIKNGTKLIAQNAFYKNQNIEEITIPDSVNYINHLAFYQCFNLTSVIFGENSQLKEYGCGVFVECEKLSVVTIPETVEYMNSQVFENCTSLENIFIPASVAEMGPYIFEGCESLKSIEVDKDNPNYSSDNYGVLYNKDKTTLISYPAGSDFETYYISNDVTVIEQDAFWKSQNLVEVIFEKNCKVKEIEYGTFLGAKSLKTITLPASIEIVGKVSFGSCEKLEAVYFERGSKVSVIGDYAFRGCSSLKLIDIPNQIYTVGYQTFYECKSLEKITIPKTDSICDKAFYRCESLKSVVIPDSVTRIGDFAFTGCESLTDVYYMGSPSEWQKIEITYQTENIENIINCNAPLKNATIHYAKNDGDTEVTTKIVVDNETNISLEYIKNFYTGNIEITVDNCLDDMADAMLSDSIDIKQSLIYDIKMTVDGVETQPNGKVTVKIPMPEGYAPTKTAVYHVDTALNRVENMNAEYIDGYLVFETNHFSYYAVVEEAETIVNIPIPTHTTISYGDSIILHAGVENMPEGAYIKWTASNDNFEIVEISADGKTCKITPESSGDTTFTVTIYDAEGNVLAEDTQKMESKAGFFNKIIAFFKKLFGLTKTYTEAII